MPSTGDLSTLPDVGNLLRLTQSLAMLDAILCPEWQYRYHSFNQGWADGEQMASMRDGCGDGYFVVFNRAGAIMKGFAHESEVWRSALANGLPTSVLFAGVPEEFAAFLVEPAFSIEDTTFCLWRRPIDPGWQAGSGVGDRLDGSADLLQLLDGDPETYRIWAGDYFETDVARWAVDHIYAHRPLDQAVVVALNPEITSIGLAGDLSEIGYPSKGSA